MNLLYSNILPLGTEEGQETVSNQLKEEIANSDAIEIAVGYVSKASLEELDRIVTEQQIHHVILTIGMYFVEGMPEAMYHTAVAINQKWVVAGIGEIRMVRAFKYHGKLYAFYRDQQVRSAIVGSANLGLSNKRPPTSVSMKYPPLLLSSRNATKLPRLFASWPALLVLPELTKLQA